MSRLQEPLEAADSHKRVGGQEDPAEESLQSSVSQYTIQIIQFHHPYQREIDHREKGPAADIPGTLTSSTLVTNHLLFRDFTERVKEHQEREHGQCDDLI